VNSSSVNSFKNNLNNSRLTKKYTKTLNVTLSEPEIEVCVRIDYYDLYCAAVCHKEDIDASSLRLYIDPIRYQ